MRINKYNELNSIQKFNLPLEKSFLKLKLGDIFKAQIIDIQQDKVLLCLDNGMSIEAKLQNELLEMKIGETMLFKVKSNSNEQILLETLKNQNENPKLNIILDALDSANLLATSENIEMVEKLLDNHLSIDKSSLQDIFLKLKNNPNLKLEEIIFFINNEIPINEENINQLKNYVLHNFNLEEQINEFMGKINNIKDYNLKLELLNSYDIADSLPFTSLQKEIKSLIYIYENYEFLNDIIIDERNLNNNLTLLNNNKIKSFLLEDNEILNFFKQHIKEFMINNKDKSHLEITLSDKFKSLFKVVQNDINIPLEQLKDQKKLDETLNKLYKFVIDIENRIGSNDENEITNISKQIKNNLEFMNQLNKYETYVQIPININNNNTQVEIYVFRRNKNKRNKSSSISAFIALDLKNLGHLEIFLQKNLKDIYCQFRLENEIYKDIIKKHIQKLINSLSNKGYNLKNITFEKLEEKFNILKPTENNSDLNEELKRYSFDMRV
ncbi:flagellar hook-length control protein FliK [Defluviitalea phaphyphila]|uniref:flagellar hook-length control protein FliK n=1 Tax=Defluviitalea phaphyphila TaxID=1473580 RepID=UPI0007310847|nr:flagellar hook-length control protein FliK [Defluviitalea phaphyphila]